MQHNSETTVSGKIDSQIICKTGQGVEIRAEVLRLTRYLVTFEINDPNCILQTSEVLEQFEIKLNDRTTYSGRAVIANLVNTGGFVVCEATLNESWLDVPGLAPTGSHELRAGFNSFLQQWQKFYKIQPEYKVVVADIQSFLTDLRLWLGQIELGIRSPKAANAAQIENAVALELSRSTTPVITRLFEEFERTAARIQEEPETGPRRLRQAPVAFAAAQLALFASHLSETARLRGRL